MQPIPAAAQRLPRCSSTPLRHVLQLLCITALRLSLPLDAAAATANIPAAEARVPARFSSSRARQL